LTRFVLDASVAMAWCFPDENDSYAGTVLQALLESEAVAPAIWPLEVANALTVAVRRKRLRPVEELRFLTLLEQLSVVIDISTAAHAFGKTLLLAREMGLSAYDASYLELALRESVPLATLDAALRKAARKAGVEVFALAN